MAVSDQILVVGVLGVFFCYLAIMCYVVWDEW